MFMNEIGNIRHSVHSPENLNIYYEGKKKMFLSNSELQVCRIRQTQRQLKLLALPCFQLKTSPETEKWNFSRKEENFFSDQSFSPLLACTHSIVRISKLVQGMNIYN